MNAQPVNPNSLITQERSEGPTPKGGAYAIIFYLDDEWDLTTKDVATHFEVIEYGADGRSFFHTRGDRTPLSE
jgi:hypothetical protein